jgi:hypothetical protein
MATQLTYAIKGAAAGTVQLGFAVADVNAFHAAKSGHLKFPRPPKAQHGVTIASFLDSEGAECSVSGQR